MARGGNLLLNIGPTADGRIPVIMQQRLQGMGRWLRINGDAIYGTRAWSKAPPINKETIVFYSTKGRNLFVMITDRNVKQIVVDGIKKPASVKLLGYKGNVRFTHKGSKLTVTLPTEA